MTENSYPPGQPAGTVPSSRARTAMLFALLLPLAACVTNPFEPPPPAGGSAIGKNTPRGNVQEEVFKQFTDIPIPTDADLAIEESLVLGTEDGWIGRLSLDVGHPMIDMYAFYTREMPRFSWEQLTTVRARISTMTYRRGTRVATITLQPRSSIGTLSNLGSGTTIDFTVAPANRSVIEGAGATSGGGAPVRPVNRGG
jgi:hypothetical protein